MFSPERIKVEEKHDSIINKTPERLLSSPLRVFSPLIDAIRSNQTKATRDFDRFYGNLTSWVNLTPRTANNRITKHTPEMANKIKQQHREIGRTSLTPLLERHSIRERKHSFEKTSPPRFLLETPDSQMEEYKTPQSSRLEKMWLDDEAKRIERLQTTLSGIKRQSSLLAEDSISKNIPSTITLTDDDDDDNNFSIMSPSDRYQIYRYNNTNNTNNNNNDYNNSNNNISNHDNNKLTSILTTSTSPLKESFNHAPYKRYRLHDTSLPPTKDDDGDNEILTTPIKKKAKLIRPPLTTELKRTSSTSSIHDRFWKEIKDLDDRKNSQKHRIEKQNTIKKRISTNNWASDDGFWSDQSSNAPVASKLNYRLYTIAKQEEERKLSLEQRNKMDYEHSCII